MAGETLRQAVAAPICDRARCRPGDRGRANRLTGTGQSGSGGAAHTTDARRRRGSGGARSAAGRARLDPAGFQGKGGAWHACPQAPGSARAHRKDGVCSRPEYPYATPGGVKCRAASTGWPRVSCGEILVPGWRVLFPFPLDAPPGACGDCGAGSFSLLTRGAVRDGLGSGNPRMPDRIASAYARDALSTISPGIAPGRIGGAFPGGSAPREPLATACPESLPRPRGASGLRGRRPSRPFACSTNPGSTARARQSISATNRHYQGQWPREQLPPVMRSPGGTDPAPVSEARPTSLLSQRGRRAWPPVRTHRPMVATRLLRACAASTPSRGLRSMPSAAPFCRYSSDAQRGDSWGRRCRRSRAGRR